MALQSAHAGLYATHPSGASQVSQCPRIASLPAIAALKRSRALALASFPRASLHLPLARSDVRIADLRALMTTLHLRPDVLRGSPAKGKCHQFRLDMVDITLAKRFA